MEILGVGPAELLFIVLIALILLGPKDMIAAGRTIGKVLRSILTSPTWMVLKKTGEELQQLPTRLVREAGLEDIQKEVQDMAIAIKPLNIKKSIDEIQSMDPDKSLVLPSDPTRPAPAKDAEKPQVSNSSSSEQTSQNPSQNNQ